jgi:hypothetical protein
MGSNYSIFINTTIGKNLKGEAIVPYKSLITPEIIIILR